ncbi:hypothetical protein EYF80_068386 [Liparis tanakae]|uniref:Uncharacterized protein n=1 Tax=Liparis tanakae TaxID=230148 RepID=A0A4Z2DY54_9TELE|nr:hypothetical protein EYF80_068386 [Liparis tanakae]
MPHDVTESRAQLLSLNLIGHFFWRHFIPVGTRGPQRACTSSSLDTSVCSSAPPFSDTMIGQRTINSFFPPVSKKRLSKEAEEDAEHPVRHLCVTVTRDCAWPDDVR